MVAWALAREWEVLVGSENESHLQRLERLLPVLCLDAQNCAGIKSFLGPPVGHMSFREKYPLGWLLIKLERRRERGG